MWERPPYVGERKIEELAAVKLGFKSGGGGRKSRTLKRYFLEGFGGIISSIAFKKECLFLKCVPISVLSYSSVNPNELHCYIVTYKSKTWPLHFMSSPATSVLFSAPEIKHIQDK